MTVISFDDFITAFLSKITDFDFANVPEEEEDYRTNEFDGYLKRAIVQFKKVCVIDFTFDEDDDRSFAFDFESHRMTDAEIYETLDEIIEIVSEGMVIQYLKPYLYHQELLQNQLNTKDFTSYSPANLLSQVKGLYADAKRNYRNMVFDYSYSHNKLTELHS